MMKNRLFIFFTIFSMLGTGCCSLMHGTSQEIPVNSVPSGARVFHNGIPAGTTPAVLELKRNAHHTIRVEKEGFVPYEETLSRSTSGWVWGNIFFGGIIGFVIDVADGARYYVEPQRVQAILVPSQETPVASAPEKNNPLKQSEKNDSSSAVSRLKILKELHDEGMLTDAEYQEKREETIRDL